MVSPYTHWLRVHMMIEGYPTPAATIDIEAFDSAFVSIDSTTLFVAGAGQLSTPGQMLGTAHDLEIAVAGDPADREIFVEFVFTGLGANASAYQIELEEILYEPTRSLT